MSKERTSLMGVTAALLPGLVVSILVFLAFSIIGPIFGLVSPAAIGGGVAVVLLVLYFVYTFTLVGGAVVGGALAD